MNYYHHKEVFELERGGVLPEITIAYKTLGNPATAQRTVWVCHALTANADAADWWNGLVGTSKYFDPASDYIICANILGSCYGTTGPLSIHPHTGSPYYNEFPLITIRDMVKAHQILRKALNIGQIDLLIGGSMGGYQAMEWALLEPGLIRKLVLLATSAAESAWGIATHTAQRMAIEADASWNTATAEAGEKGLKVARAIGMLTYRNYQLLVDKQTDDNIDKIDDFKASSYILYQGDKLARRFNAYSYWHLTKAMDSHNIARNTGKNIPERLADIAMPTLIIGINSDILCPIVEQELLCQHIPDATLAIIDSTYGHDGFIIEAALIEEIIRKWYSYP